MIALEICALMLKQEQQQATAADEESQNATEATHASDHPATETEHQSPGATECKAPERPSARAQHTCSPPSEAPADTAARRSAFDRELDSMHKHQASASLRGRLVERVAGAQSTQNKSVQIVGAHAVAGPPTRLELAGGGFPATYAICEAFLFPHALADSSRGGRRLFRSTVAATSSRRIPRRSVPRVRTLPHTQPATRPPPVTAEHGRQPRFFPTSCSQAGQLPHRMPGRVWM